MKLNLGCGNRLFPGYLNIDMVRPARVPTGCEFEQGLVTALPERAQDVEEIIAIHVFEHFYRSEVDSVLQHWGSRMKPGGKLILEMPDLAKVLNHFANNGRPNMTMWGLYGDPGAHTGTQDIHKWCWSFEELTQVLTANGFERVTYEKPLFKQPARDLRVEAFKS